MVHRTNVPHILEGFVSPASCVKLKSEFNGNKVCGETFGHGYGACSNPPCPLKLLLSRVSDKYVLGTQIDIGSSE